MPTADQAREAARRAQDSPSFALPIALLILAIIAGVGALALTVFGVWPGVILVVACAAAAAIAVHKIKKQSALEERLRSSE